MKNPKFKIATSPYVTEDNSIQFTAWVGKKKWMAKVIIPFGAIELTRILAELCDEMRMKP